MNKTKPKTHNSLYRTNNKGNNSSPYEISYINKVYINGFWILKILSLLCVCYRVDVNRCLCAMGAHSKSPLGVNSHLTCLFEKGIFLWVSTGGPWASEDSPVSVSHFPILCWACVWALGIRTRVLVFVQQTHCSENRVVMETFEFHFIFLYLVVVV